MTDPISLNLKKMDHVKADNFINEVVDKFTLTGFQNGNALSVMLTLGRDTVNISHETIIPEAEGGGSRLDNDAVSPYRLDVATLTLSLDAAKSLAESLLKMVNEAPQPAKQV